MNQAIKVFIVGLVQAIVSMLMSYMIREVFERYIFPKLDKMWPKKKKRPVGFGTGA